MPQSIAVSPTGWPRLRVKLGGVGTRRLKVASEQDRLENLERAWDHWNELISAEQRLGGATGP